MSWASVLLFAAAAYGLVWIGRRVFGGTSRIRPLTVLGVAAVIGGLAVFGGRGANHVIHVRSDRWSPVEEHLIDDEVSASVPSQSLWRSESERLNVVGHDLKWVLISLGSVLVISGALLAGRGRARPVALKALTVLGLAAAAYAMVTFVSSAPRHIWGNYRDRIVKNDRVITIDDDSSSDESPPPVTPPKKPKRAHAKRPTSRPERRDSTEELIAKIPPRAGEIPVTDELANTAAKTESASEWVAPPSPAVADGVSIPTPEPSQLTEPAAVAKAPEQPKPADPIPVQSAVKTPDATDVSKPVKEPTPETTPPPAAAPSPLPVAAVSKPAAKASPPVKSSVPAPIQSAAERPAWVDMPGKLVDAVYRVSVNSGPYVTVPECQRNLDLQMKDAADHYVDDYLGEGASDVVGISLGYLRKHVKKAEFNEVITSTVGPMQQIYALLEFDDGVRADFQHRWHAAVVGRRLWYVGASTGLVLALLATLYGYLRLDLRTGGTHKGQLQLAAALVALILTAGALLVQSKLPF